MRVPLSWLRDFTPIATDPRDIAAVGELARTLDSLGLVVEAVERIESGPTGVVLARVLAIEAIEGADRIRLVHADRGDGAPLEIVCGATNFAVGDVVPLAPVGTVLPGGMEIAQRKMRGVTSNGMLCSGRELGLSEDGEGLLILASPGPPPAPVPGHVALGTALGEYLGIEDDVVFDIAVEPNRPDCLCIAGIARDLAARLGLPFAIPEPKVTESGPPVGELGTISIAAPEACHGLVARVVTGLSAFSSPTRIARRLELAGMRPISAVVDATNYVMLELGQPTHAYDLDRLGGAGIGVRLARAGETLVTLDGASHALEAGPPGSEASLSDCVICDATDVPVGLAGVMGGADSETSDATTRILLEVADFDPIVVGRAAARHGLRTEASARFWRGVDSAGQTRAANRVLELIVAAAAAAGAPAPVVATGVLEERPVQVGPARIRLRSARLNAVLGTELGAAEIAAYLSPIGFHTSAIGADLEVEAPTFRPDARAEVDLIEEVARHHGYEQITPTDRRSPRVGRLSDAQSARRSLRRVLQGLSADEVWTSTLVDPAAARRAGEMRTPVELANPVVAWESVLRTHLLPGMLEVERYNASHRNGALRLFEFGHVFVAGAEPGSPPVERDQLGVLLALETDTVAAASATLEALVDARRVAPDLFALVALDALDAQDQGIALGCHPTRSAALVTPAGKLVGALGEVDPLVLAAFELEERPVGWLCLDFEAFLGLDRRTALARPISHNPSSDVDLAFVLAEEVPARRLEAVLRGAAGALCEELRLIDVYRSAQLGEDLRSLTYRLRFCALDHTLTDEELSELRGACIAAVEAELPARLRA